MTDPVDHPASTYIPAIWDDKYLRDGRHDDMVISLALALMTYSWVRRTWRERLFSWPWRPWVRWKLIEVPFPTRAGDRVKIKTLTP